MSEVFNPPNTVGECHQVLDAILDKILSFDGNGAVWFKRYDQIRSYAEKTWPDEFLPQDENEISIL